MKNWTSVLWALLCSVLFFSCGDDANGGGRKPLNFDKLYELRTQIETRIEESEIGLNDGMYPLSSYDDLVKALDALNVGISKARAGSFVLQFEVDGYTLAAEKAVKLFDSSKIETLPVGTPAELFVNGIDQKGHIDFGASQDYCGGPAFTVETWVKTNDGYIETAFGSFISTFISPAPYKGWTLHYWGTTNSLLRFSIGTNNADLNLSLPTIYTAAPSDFGTWYHVAATFSAGEKLMKLYINGEFKSSTVVNDAMVINGGEEQQMWAFMEPKDKSRCMSGFIKKFRVWSQTKTENEVKTLMTTDVAGTEAGLVCAWDFVETPADAENILDKTGRHTAKIVGIHKWNALNNN